MEKKCYAYRPAQQSLFVGKTLGVVFLLLFSSFSFSQNTTTLSVPYSTSVATNGGILSNSIYYQGCHASISGTTLTVYQDYYGRETQTLSVPSGSTVVGTTMTFVSGSASCNSCSCSWAGSQNIITRTCTNGSCFGCEHGIESGSCDVTLNVYAESPYCAMDPTVAQALLSARQLMCEAQGGDYSGEVVHKNNGDYCVEGECNLSSSCPADNPAPPAQRRIVLGKKLESEPKEENTYDYTLQYKPKPFYDALGRRTEPRPETRRHLFEKRSKAAVRGREPDMGAVLRIEEPVGQCCVESFGVRLVGDVQNIIIDDKVGVNIEFNAKFHGEEYEPGCNPSCCEFKQESKGSIFKNGNPRDTTTCRIDGVYIVYDSTAYVPDCYGRDCSHSKKGMDKYNDSLGTYKGTDFPGLNNISIIDTVDIRMEFNSYIKDKCNANEVKASKYWGFHMQGNIFDNDSLDYTLLGGISQ